MSAKFRIKVGDAVISWGIVPESLVHDRAVACEPRRFTVIDGGRANRLHEQDDTPTQAKSA